MKVYKEYTGLTFKAPHFFADRFPGIPLENIHVVRVDYENGKEAIGFYVIHPDEVLINSEEMIAELRAFRREMAIDGLLKKGQEAGCEPV